MNRFKKELRKSGVKLECDYPWIPYEQNGMVLEGVSVDSEAGTYTEYYTSITIIFGCDRGMNCTVIDFD